MSRGKEKVIRAYTILDVSEDIKEEPFEESIEESSKHPLKKSSSFKNSLIGKPKLKKIFSFFFRIFGVTFFFIFFEIAFFFLLSRMGNIFYEMWILQISIVSGYGLFVYSSLLSNKFKILKIFKIFTSILMLALSVFLFWIVIIIFMSLVVLKIILGTLIAYYTLNLILTIKSDKTVVSKTKIKSLAIISLIFSSCIGILTVMTFAPNTIEIEPKTEPEIIFWCGSNQLPDDPDILEMCKKYNIGFMPTIRNHMVSDDEYMQSYKNIISHGINLYFTIGGDSSFFANIDNAKEFPLIYKNIRQWFINESIMNSPHVVSFSLDAEPPKDYEENINKEYLISSMKYGADNYPTKKEIEEATEAMKEFIDAIKEDGKKYGMIRAAELLDSSDGDGDLSLYTRNLYSLDVEWDFTISMLYRTNRLQGDESETEPPQFLAASMSLFLGAVIEGTKFTNSELSFYQNVALLQNGGDTCANERYIFVGNFEKEFENTKYIKEKMYKRDLDICRHFGAERVFFYDLKGFVSHYGWEGIEELGLHNKQKDKWDLKYNNSKSIMFLMLYCGLILIDIFAFFERDLQ